ncbi:SHOCT domain-containing protein [Bacillus sp. 1P06AnD]|uniref:SHOCT domain-containing protein n=1 Tax=Bacillus sp. 1P06AnD TaxID=3132208 RepID=UPI0039A29765
MKTFEFKAAGKTLVTIDNQFLRIKRKGALNFFNHGMDGEKTIDITNMSGVQVKKAGSMTNGYIQFIFMGSKENKGGLMAATKDENTIMYAKKEQSYVDEIQKYVEDMIANRNKNSVIIQEVKTDVSEEIRKFKALMDDGIISEEEFQSKKKQLLGI